MSKKSVQMFSTPKDNRCLLKTNENIRKHVQKPKSSIGCQTDRIELLNKMTNTPNYVDEMLSNGKNLTNDQFQVFLQERASDCYWKILAERARLELDDQLRENRQLHELLEQLNKDNEMLQVKSEHCEYLTHVFNSITSDYDSGIELHMTDESPLNKRRRIHF